jgi:hypothetical protein
MMREGARQGFIDIDKQIESTPVGASLLHHLVSHRRRRCC